MILGSIKIEQSEPKSLVKERLLNANKTDEAEEIERQSRFIYIVNSVIYDEYFWLKLLMTTCDSKIMILFRYYSKML